MNMKNCCTKVWAILFLAFLSLALTGCSGSISVPESDLQGRSRSYIQDNYEIITFLRSEYISDAKAYDVYFEVIRDPSAWIIKKDTVRVRHYYIPNYKEWGNVTASVDNTTYDLNFDVIPKNWTVRTKEYYTTNDYYQYDLIGYMNISLVSVNYAQKSVTLNITADELIFPDVIHFPRLDSVSALEKSGYSMKGENVVCPYRNPYGNTFYIDCGSYLNRRTNETHRFGLEISNNNNVIYIWSNDDENYDHLFLTEGYTLKCYYPYNSIPYVSVKTWYYETNYYDGEMNSSDWDWSDGLFVTEKTWNRDENEWYVEFTPDLMNYQWTKASILGISGEDLNKLPTTENQIEGYHYMTRPSSRTQPTITENYTGRSGYTDSYINTSVKEQTAIVIKTLYPRPRPGAGKNEENYNQSIGCTVTVHTKHQSLSGTDMWVCISGWVKDYGNSKYIDHQWINSKWLDSNSYSLDLVPYDPNY